VSCYDSSFHVNRNRSVCTESTMEYNMHYKIRIQNRTCKTILILRYNILTLDYTYRKDSWEDDQKSKRKSVHALRDGILVSVFTKFQFDKQGSIGTPLSSSDQ
jgi:hypothetical protein